MANKKERPIAVDIYSGVGGLSLGFKQAGFTIKAAFDNKEINTTTYSQNFPGTYVDNVDLSIVTGEQLREKSGINNNNITVLIGGPPCQGFSYIGKREKNDPRNSLILHFARLVEELSPEYFVLENVPGLLSGQAREFLTSFLITIRKAGYSVLLPIKVLNANDYGVPQNRSRLFIIGYRKGNKKPTYPSPLYTSSKRNGRPTVKDAIGDLPNIGRYKRLLVEDQWKGRLGKPSTYAAKLRKKVIIKSDVKKNKKINNYILSGCRRTEHTSRTIKRFSRTRQGTYEPISRLFRLSANGFSPTLRAGTGPEKGSFMAARPIHPTQSRCITVREAARLQSFPDWFEFHTTKWHAFMQIGNSVPPFLAKNIARSLLKVIKKNKWRKNVGKS